MRIVFACAALWFASADSIVAAGDPALPGHHPLTQAQAGDVLIAELHCAACHTEVRRSSLPERTAPDLTAVGTRIEPDYLRRFLAAPSSAHAGTTMPDVLASRAEGERDGVAEALTHFLVAQSKLEALDEVREPIDLEQGKTLFHSVGCVACHGPKESPPPVTKRNDEDDDDDTPAIAARKKIKPISVPLGHIAAKYDVRYLSAFCFNHCE